MTGFFFMVGVNLLLTLVATVLCAVFTPNAAGPGVPEIKAYLNGVDTPNMYGANTLFVKVHNSYTFLEREQPYIIESCKSFHIRMSCEI